MIKTFLILLIVSLALCYDTSRRVTDDGDRHLGYFLKSVEDLERPRENALHKDPFKIESRSKGYSKDDRTEKRVVFVVEPSDPVVNYIKEGRVKPSPERTESKEDAVPLHVTNTARQQCVEGFAVDENGVCQKIMAPKGEKSFKLRRRKRAEQTAPKLSYADVVKYGKNPPKHLLTTTVKAEILTTTQRTVEIKKLPVTTPAPKMGAVTTVKTGGVQTTVLPAKGATVKPTVPQVKGVTIQPTSPSVKAATIKPAAVVTTVKSVVKPGSKFDDINQAFLSVEKSSVVAQSSDGKGKMVVVPVAEKKTIDVTRLRRSIGFK